MHDPKGPQSEEIVANATCWTGLVLYPDTLSEGSNQRICSAFNGVKYGDISELCCS